MIRNRFFLYAVAATLAVACFVSADEKVRSTNESNRRAAPPASNGKTRIAANTISAPAAESGPVHELAAKLSKAFNRGDAAAFAAAFTPEAEYIDESGNAFRGRRAIEAEFRSLFAANQDAKIRLQFDTPRLISTGLLAADGKTEFTPKGTQDPVSGIFSAIIVTEGELWLIASLRESKPDSRQASHHERVSELAWLIGEWIDEGSNYHMHFSCRWDETKNYLLRDFAVHVGGKKISSGHQRIGYDPQAGRLKSWVFDSNGAFSEGFIDRDGDNWTFHSAGITTDGHIASGANVFTRVSDHRMHWQSVDNIVDGKRMPDSGKIVIVSKPPTPTARAR